MGNQSKLSKPWPVNCPNCRKPMGHTRHRIEQKDGRSLVCTTCYKKHQNKPITEEDIIKSKE